MSKPPTPVFKLKDADFVEAWTKIFVEGKTLDDFIREYDYKAKGSVYQRRTVLLRKGFDLPPLKGMAKSKEGGKDNSALPLLDPNAVYMAACLDSLGTINFGEGNYFSVTVTLSTRVAVVADFIQKHFKGLRPGENEGVSLFRWYGEELYDLLLAVAPFTKRFEAEVGDIKQLATMHKALRETELSVMRRFKK